TLYMTPTIVETALAEMDRLGLVGMTTHGEKAAAYMVDGYARARRGPGICVAQTVGSANLAAGLRDACLAGSPVVAITGGMAPATHYRHVYQEIEDFPLYDQATKFNAQVQSIERLPDLVWQAFREATTGPSGPVHLELEGLSGSLHEHTWASYRL
ncbi:MAG TPA: thiamine pyrophosphate-binding protein, partial [Acidimicrobiales bacterium]|nr:thiamine pyrophosphate-binding protein [Acidimicrobiales bacterium]